MRADRNKAVAIACRAAIRTGLTLPSQPHSHSIVDTCRDDNIHFDFVGDVTVAATLIARMGNQRPSTMARGTRSLYADETSGLHHLAAATAPPAGFWRRTRLGSRSFALFAALT